MSFVAGHAALDSWRSCVWHLFVALLLAIAHGSVGAMPRRHFDVTVVLMPVNVQSMVSDDQLQVRVEHEPASS